MRPEIKPEHADITMPARETPLDCSAEEAVATINEIREKRLLYLAMAHSSDNKRVIPDYALQPEVLTRHSLQYYKNTLAISEENLDETAAVSDNEVSSKFEQRVPTFNIPMRTPSEQDYSQQSPNSSYPRLNIN